MVVISVKRLLAFGVCGPLLMMSVHPLQEDMSISLLITHAYTVADFFLIAISCWCLFSFFDWIFLRFANEHAKIKSINSQYLVPAWSVSIGSLSYLIVTQAIDTACSTKIQIDTHLPICFAGASISLMQALTIGALCGATATSLTNSTLDSSIAKEYEKQIFANIKLITTRSKSLWWTLPILTTLGIFILFYAGYFPLKGGNYEEKGQFGDSFGVLNSLFSGLAFGGLIITLLYQQKQISQQEKESITRREFDETQHYEDTFYKLLSIYSQTLEQVTNKKGDLIGRQVLRGSIDRAYSSLKSHNVNSIPQILLRKYEKNQLSLLDEQIIDYVYFRNFKILSVELEKQKRLVETFRILLRHTSRSLPKHLSGERYFDLIKAQINHTEASYFFLVALTFEDESDLRQLISENRLLEKIANTKVTRVHEMMYCDFWKVDIRQHKIKQRLPISRKRIDQAIKAFERSSHAGSASSLRTYTPVKVKTKSDGLASVAPNGPASNEPEFDTAET